MKKLSEEQEMVIAILSAQLFHAQVKITKEIDWQSVCDEAIQQAVFPFVALTAAPYLSSKKQSVAKKIFMSAIARNMQIDYEHAQLNELLTANDIPYVILKGAASGFYYPEPILRMMGDVDFLIRESDFQRAGALLETAGFRSEKDSGGIHVGYHRTGSVWEMHRMANGVPAGIAGKRTKEYLSDIIDTAVTVKSSKGSYRIPDRFHHGLVLLLHTVSHMTSSGIGLRHLCDWAVFAASMSDREFCDVFEQPLKEIGMWRFAQLLTLCAVHYLGCPAKTWAGEADEELLTAMICDILNSGNFGQKDADRYRQIKYIANRGENTVDEKGPIRQVIHTMNRKVKAECSFVARHPVLLPAGWIFVGGTYLRLVFLGKRQLDSGKTIEAAKERKAIYQEFHLFETGGETFV